MSVACTIEFRSSGGTMCGDLTPVYPTTGPVGVMIVKRCVNTAWSMDVPIGWKYTNPFGSMYRTMLESAAQ